MFTWDCCDIIVTNLKCAVLCIQPCKASNRLFTWVQFHTEIVSNALSIKSRIFRHVYSPNSTVLVNNNKNISDFKLYALFPFFFWKLWEESILFVCYLTVLYKDVSKIIHKLLVSASGCPCSILCMFYRWSEDF